MSYDLTLYKSREGHPSSEEYYKLLEEQEQRVVDNTQPINFDVIQCGNIFNEFNDELKTEMTASHSDWVEIYFTYGKSGQEVIEMFKRINFYLKRLAECGGYYVFDPQKGEAFDPKVTELNGISDYLRGTAVLQDIQAKKPTYKIRLIGWLQVVTTIIAFIIIEDVTWQYGTVKSTGCVIITYLFIRIIFKRFINRI
jgi:hypothetical protein